MLAVCTLTAFRAWALRDTKQACKYPPTLISELLCNFLTCSKHYNDLGLKFHKVYIHRTEFTLPSDFSILFLKLKNRYSVTHVSHIFTFLIICYNWPFLELWPVISKTTEWFLHLCTNYEALHSVIFSLSLLLPLLSTNFLLRILVSKTSSLANFKYKTEIEISALCEVKIAPLVM